MPNPSFEDYTQCPCADNQVEFAAPWLNVSWTPDFFHDCTNEYAEPFGCLVGVPVNWRGVQSARTGKGYAGIFTYDDTAPDARERLSVRLSTPLVAEQSYSVSLYVSLSDRSNHATAPIGLLLTDTSLESISNSAFFDFTPQVESNELIADNQNWHRIEGCFVATGGEEYLTIGSFSIDSEMTFVRLFTSGQDNSFYYLDDVEVMGVDSCIPDPLVLDVPNVFTPNGDGVNDLFEVIGSDSLNGQLWMFDRWGRRIHSMDGETLYWDGTENGRPLQEGIYYYFISVIGRDRKRIEKKGFVHLLR